MNRRSQQCEFLAYIKNDLYLIYFDFPYAPFLLTQAQQQLHLINGFHYDSFNRFKLSSIIQLLRSTHHPISPNYCLSVNEFPVLERHVNLVYLGYEQLL